VGRIRLGRFHRRVRARGLAAAGGADACASRGGRHRVGDPARHAAAAADPGRYARPAQRAVARPGERGSCPRQRGDRSRGAGLGRRRLYRLRRPAVHSRCLAGRVAAARPAGGCPEPIHPELGR
jgi:hypothetical protein